MTSLLMACGSDGSSSEDAAEDSINITFAARYDYFLEDESITLEWDATGATSCTISGVFVQEGGKQETHSLVTGESKIELSSDPLVPIVTPIENPGSEELAILNSSGSVNVFPEETKSYTITCINDDALEADATTEVYLSADIDGDNYPDDLETIVGTSVSDADSDDDGILDGDEDVNRNGIVDAGETSPTNPASRNPYYCDSLRRDNEGNGFDVGSTCTNPEILSMSGSHVCLIMKNNFMRCWGNNQNFQLGRNNDGDRMFIGDDETAREGGITIGGYIQVSAGGDSTCALKSSGVVHCWGHSRDGVTGHKGGLIVPESTLGSRLDLPEAMIQVSTSGRHSCSVSDIGNLYCWGNNSRGELGNETTNNVGDVGYVGSFSELEPVDIGFPVRQVSTGDNFTCALSTHGTVKCWGTNDFGETGQPYDLTAYGNHTGDAEGEAPVHLPEVTINGGSVFKIASYANSSCAMANGAMTCWGRGNHGQLGYASTEHVGDDELSSDYGSVPYGGGAVSNLSVGRGQTCINLETGEARCWGTGNLGNGNAEPIGDDESAASSGDINFGGKQSLYIATGGTFSCALMTDETLYCWGNNAAGQLGQGHTDAIPLAINGEVDYQ